MYVDPSIVVFEEALDALAPLPENNAKIPETTFKQTILPIIANYTPDMDTSVWIRITGTYDRGIDVYSDDGSEFLFTVPPMFTQLAVHTAPSNEASIAKVVEDYKNMIGRMPRVADNMLLTSLGEKVKQSPLSEKQLADIKTIVSRYNVKLAGVAADEPTAIDYEDEDL